jgi:hypothetical protein
MTQFHPTADGSTLTLVAGPESTNYWQHGPLLQWMRKNAVADY